MRRILTFIFILLLIGAPVNAMDLSPPTVPRSAEEFMVQEPENLKEGIIEIFKKAVVHFRPDLREASRVCLGIIGAVMTVSLVRTVPGGIEK